MVMECNANGIPAVSDRERSKSKAGSSVQPVLLNQGSLPPNIIEAQREKEQGDAEWSRIHRRQRQARRRQGRLAVAATSMAYYLYQIFDQRKIFSTV